MNLDDIKELLDSTDEINEVIKTYGDKVWGIVKIVINKVADYYGELEESNTGAKFARAQYQWFKNLTDAGFTENQAIMLMSKNTNIPQPNVKFNK